MNYQLFENNMRNNILINSYVMDRALHLNSLLIDLAKMRDLIFAIQELSFQYDKSININNNINGINQLLDYFRINYNYIEIKNKLTNLLDTFNNNNKLYVILIINGIIMTYMEKVIITLKTINQDRLPRNLILFNSDFISPFKKIYHKMNPNDEPFNNDEYDQIMIYINEFMKNYFMKVQE